MSNRLIAIGDIHGEIEKLNLLIEKLKPTLNDTIIFLGDYIDRGKDSKAVISRLIDLKKEPNCIFLMGNHEDVLLNVLKTKNTEYVEHWLSIGGIATFKNYGDTFLPLSHIKFLKGLKLYYQTEDYFFVHAGINPVKSLQEQEKSDFLWIREDFIYKKHNLKQKIIFAHTPFEVPFIQPDKIGIDTGCGKHPKGTLTAFICDEERFVTI